MQILLRNMISGLNEREMGDSQSKQVGRETFSERLPIKLIKKMFYLALPLEPARCRVLKKIFFLLLFFIFSNKNHFIELKTGNINVSDSNDNNLNCPLYRSNGQYEHHCFWMILSLGFCHIICTQCLKRFCIHWVNLAVASTDQVLRKPLMINQLCKYS